VMSKTYSIVCDECKVDYWCGQNSHIYSAETMALFLHEHIGHPLRFVDNAVDELIEDYKDFEEQE
jgi:hypothetical protein